MTKQGTTSPYAVHFSFKNPVHVAYVIPSQENCITIDAHTDIGKNAAINVAVINCNMKITIIPGWYHNQIHNHFA